MLRSVAFASLLLSFYLLKICEATSLGPGARKSACTTVYNNTLYVWGGVEDSRYSNSSNSSYFNSYANFTSASLPLSTTDIAWVDLSWNIPAYLANPNQVISTWPCVVSPTGILVVGGNEINDTGAFIANSNNMFGYDLIANMYVQLNITGGNPFDILIGRNSVRRVQVEDSLYVFGGYSGYGLNKATAIPQPDMYILNLTTWEWSVGAVNNPQSIPPNYDWPSLVYGGNGFIYMFGGSQNTSITAPVYYSDTYKFDINARTWSLVIPNGAQPNAYDDATSVAYDGKIYIFEGGTSNETSGFSPTASFCTRVTRLYDIASNSFSVQTNYNNLQYAAPAELYFPAAVVANDAIISVSGQTCSTQDSQGIWIYNLSIQDWTTTAAAGPYLPSRLKISTTSAVPSISTAPSTYSTNLGVIVGPLVGGGVVIAVAAFFLIWYIRKRKSKDISRRKPDEISRRKPDEILERKPDEIPGRNLDDIPGRKPDDASAQKPYVLE